MRAIWLFYIPGGHHGHDRRNFAPRFISRIYFVSKPCEITYLKLLAELGSDRENQHPIVKKIPIETLYSGAKYRRFGRIF
jgi:hypothetical protein